jgi:nitrous oxidase accessory protein
VKTFLTIWFICLFCKAHSGTIIVGSDQSCKRLGTAIRNAKAGDTILLNSGVYREGNLIISKPLTLIGRNSPILDGELKSELLTISGKNIVVKGIHFINAGYSSMNDFAAIKVIDATGITIADNTISNASFGVHISNSTLSVIHNNTIRGNNKSEHSSGNGIHLWKCEQMLVENNRISGHRDGIYFEFVTRSTIRGNTSEKNIRYGLHFMFSHDNAYLSNIFRNNGAGVAVMYTKNVRMEKNVFEMNWGASAYGILLKDITDSHISNNLFLKNTTAIHMEGSSRIEIRNNTFKANGWAIKVQASCDDNVFHHNNFYGNTFDIATNGSASLNKFYLNYWDKYEGYDRNKDGKGDIPYHPVSIYAMIIEENPSSLMLLRSFMVTLLDRAEKALPSLTPEHLVDASPVMKPIQQ